jgi:thiamine pyrophosphokinase
MSHSTVVILANGAFPSDSVSLQILTDAEFLICCDGATDQLLKNSNRSPDLIVGDLDSLTTESKIKFSEKIIQITDQNINDLVKAFDVAMTKKPQKIIFLGASGGREDHMLANFSYFFDFAKRCDIEVYTDHGKFISITNSKKVTSFKGQQVSFFTESPNVVVSCKNLKWPLTQKSFDRLWQGSLNESISEQLEIHVRQGVCLIFLVSS